MSERAVHGCGIIAEIETRTNANVRPPAGDIAALYRAHLDTLAVRLETALEAAGFDALVILAGELAAPPRDDVTYPFRVEPHFAAWLPLVDLPGAALVLVPGRRPVLLYPQLEDFWLAPATDPEGFWVEHFEIAVTTSGAAESSELRERVRTLAREGLRVALLGEAGGSQAAQAPFAGVQDTRLLARLDFNRAYKTEYEIACQRAANAKASRGHRAVAAEFAATSASELALHEIYCGATRHRESELPYPNIIALNEHAAVLHYQHLDLEPPRQRRSLLIDAGAQVAGYAADVTRTWVGSGGARPHGRTVGRGAADGAAFAALIDSMETLQQTLCGEADAGTDFVALDDRAHELLGHVLAAHGIAACSAAEAYESGLTGTFLPHGLGHLLGLQVHDAGGHQISPDGEHRAPPAAHPFLRLTRRLEPGFVVTIEPGLYFIPALLGRLDATMRARVDWRVVEQFLPYGGIRIEDNLALETSGPRNLTREAFADVEQD
jgi:Xaa-Pro dipeptidase